MIRSITDYAAVLFENISDISKDKVETIQYYSMLHILKIPPETSHTEMREQLGTDTLSSRHKKLKEKYISKSLQNNQLII
jgi:hypothetical protein